jgi:diguanylate cyclase (GGDEF)-like protein
LNGFAKVSASGRKNWYSATLRSWVPSGEDEFDIMSITGNGLVLMGACVLGLALIPARGVIKQLPPGKVKSRWKNLTALILFFIAGYLAYTIFNWDSYGQASELLVSGIFFFGAWFVFIVNSLALQASIDVKRISKLEMENVTDSLMGIHNRRYFDLRLDQEFSRARRYDLALSLLLLDIDHFKEVNDTYGHQVGDTILVNLGQLIEETVRKPDIVARYGGEEIVVITPNAPLSGGAILAERLRELVETAVLASPSDGAPQDVSLTVSIGVSAISPEIENCNDLFERADKALYRAKHQGRNQVVLDDNSANSPDHQ